jgi:ABC-type multidrug transport system fused ATPase/permease subunit
LGRIEKYLDGDEVERPSAVDPNEPVKIGFENATIGWNVSKQENNNSVTQAEDNSDVTCASDDETPHFTLRDLNIQFPNNSLSLICGSTGCGKTLMMLSLLGETEIIKGEVLCPRIPFPTVLDDNAAVTCIDIQAIPNHDTIVTPPDWVLSHAVAYASQTPWLQNASIKDNILFGLPLLNKRYKETLAVCALDTDLGYLEDGDETEIGEKGITLSGGQKARVALARAVYSRAQNVFMDDVLSAVDAHTGKHIYQKCILGPLMKNRTLVLITHNISLCLPGSAHVVFIKDGKVELQGSPTELAQAGQLELIIQENEETPDAEEDPVDPLAEEAPKPNGEEDKKKPRVLVEEEGTIIFFKKKLLICILIFYN